MLEAHNLHKIYNSGGEELHALKGIDLKVEKGEVLLIVGPSGAGKSTLLHLLGGLDEPTSGEVLLDGINIYEASDEERAKIRNEKMGFVFQFYHLLPEFTALENVMLPALIKLRSKNQSFDKLRIDPERSRMGQKSKIKRRADELLSEVGLKDRINHKPDELSGGEGQRVAIARALINSPDIVFCDEPTGNLDSKTSEEVCSLLWRLNEERNQTFVIVTHEQEIARRADEIFRIKDGRFVK